MMAAPQSVGFVNVIGVEIENSAAKTVAMPDGSSSMMALTTLAAAEILSAVKM